MCMGVFSTYIHESDWSKNCPSHRPSSVPQVSVDLVLGLEMRNWSLIVPALLVSSAVNTAVDEVLHIIFDALVNHCLALGDLAIKRHTFAHGDLYRVGTPYWLLDDFFRSCENTWHIVEVSLDELDR